MPKLKTAKVISKRVKVTKGKKLLTKTAGQDHFNARERGNTTRNKRRLTELAKPDSKLAKMYLPYI
ncbi:MAG: 50S ribosomal protein L35 [bacterium]